MSSSAPRRGDLYRFLWYKSEALASAGLSGGVCPSCGEALQRPWPLESAIVVAPTLVGGTAK